MGSSFSRDVDGAANVRPLVVPLIVPLRVQLASKDKIITERLKKFFSHLDLDENGYVTLNELRIAVRHSRFPLFPPERLMEFLTGMGMSFFLFFFSLVRSIDARRLMYTYMSCMLLTHY